ncbi:hypothetical protein FB107DRAFT_273728 [Schizophyllum commune]
MSSQSSRQPVPNKSLFPASFSNLASRHTALSNSAYNQASWTNNNSVAVQGMQSTPFRQFARPARRPEVPPQVFNTGTRDHLVERQTLVPSPTQSNSVSSIRSVAQHSPTGSPHAQHASHSPAVPKRPYRPSIPRSTQPVSPEAQQSNPATVHAYMHSKPPNTRTEPFPSSVSQAAHAENAIPASAPAHDTIDLTLSPSPSPKLGFVQLPSASSSALRPATDLSVKTELISSLFPEGPTFASTTIQCKNEPLDTVMKDLIPAPSVAASTPTSASITAPMQSVSMTPALPVPAAPVADPPAVPTRPSKRGRPSTKNKTSTTSVTTGSKSTSTAKRPELAPADVVGASLIYTDVVKRRKRRDAVDQELIDTKLHAATLSGRLEVLDREKLPGSPQDAVVAALTAALAESHRQIAQLHGSLDDCEGLLTVYRNACLERGIVVDEYNTGGTSNYSGLASDQLPGSVDAAVAVDPMCMNGMDLGADLGLPAPPLAEDTYVWDTETCGMTFG